MPVLVAGICLSGAAQSMWHSTLPIITIQATVPLASEPGNNPASFTLFRAGATNSAVTVSFAIGGTASNGVDYAAITNIVNFAAGQVAANIAITPITESSATGYKTVVLTLPRRSNFDSLAAPEFLVGSLNKAVAYIAYNYTNVPPSVSLVAPTNGSSFLSLPNIEIAANAFDSNGWVTAVEFLANGRSLGVVSNNMSEYLPLGRLVLRESHGSMLPELLGSRVNRYQFVWTNVPAGNYALTAIATDSAGLQTTSASTDIVVTTNLPVPVVRIVSPSPGADLPDLARINVYAAAAEEGGVIDTVEFLADGGSLGLATNYLRNPPASFV